MCGLPTICGGTNEGAAIATASVGQHYITKVVLDTCVEYGPGDRVRYQHRTITPLVPETLRMTLFTSVHDLSHPGANASIRFVSDRFVWPRIKADTRRWAKTCMPCQKAQVRRHTRSPFGSFPSPDERFAHVHVDITGQSYLLTCVDGFSR